MKNKNHTTRSTFVTGKALKNFLSASILTSVAAQLAVTTDAVIVSHMIGPDAISAINVVMPLTMFFSCFSILLGLGASVLAAKAIGEHDKPKVNRIFTMSLMLLVIAGIAVSIASYSLSDQIIAIFCPDQRIAPLALSYTKAISIGAIFLILSNGINYFVSTDGSPSLVAKGVVVGAIANIFLDILLVHFMGIAGSAVATVINYIITLLIVATHFFKKNSTYRLVNPFKNFGKQFMGNFYEGLPLMLGNLLLGGAVLIINQLVLDAAGADGLYIWSICLQVLMITFVVLNGVGNAMLSIGGVFAGEKDYNGLRILTSLSLKLVCGVLAIFLLIVIAFPGVLAFMFGADSEGNIGNVNNSLRIFSLLLIPFAVTLVMRFLFQILEHRILSLLLSVGQLLFIIASLWAFIKITPENMWWSFPFSAIMLIVIQFAATFLMHLKKRNLAPITLIPREDTTERSADFSVSYSNSPANNAAERIEAFLTRCNIPKEEREKLKRCCSDIVTRLCKETGERKHCFDLHIRVIKDEIHTVLRDAGKRLETNELLKGIAAEIEHKYMYGQNVLFVRTMVTRK